MAAAGPIASAVIPAHTKGAIAPRLDVPVFAVITLASRPVAQTTIRSGNVATSPRREGACA